MLFFLVSPILDAGLNVELTFCSDFSSDSRWDLG